MPPPPIQRLSPQLFAIFRHLVEENVGLHYREEDTDSFSDKIHSRMRDAGFDSALDYYYRLRYDDPNREELTALVDTLVIGETYFFRELDPLRAAIQHVVLPAIAERGSASVWSAACATGEEPLTFAMLLAEANVPFDRCRIRATDVSRRSLARAREGRYSGRSLRLLSKPGENPELVRIADRWLETVPPQNGLAAAPTPRIKLPGALDVREVIARPEILRAIDYRQDNLLTSLPTADEASAFDLILCRNVLIYFADETVLRVVARLGDGLRDAGGRLLVGASESLLRFGTRLRCEERGGTFFYSKEQS